MTERQRRAWLRMQIAAREGRGPSGDRYPNEPYKGWLWTEVPTEFLRVAAQHEAVWIANRATDELLRRGEWRNPVPRVRE